MGGEVLSASNWLARRGSGHGISGQIRTGESDVAGRPASGQALEQADARRLEAQVEVGRRLDQRDRDRAARRHPVGPSQGQVRPERLAAPTSSPRR